MPRNFQRPRLRRSVQSIDFKKNEMKFLAALLLAIVSLPALSQSPQLTSLGVVRFVAPNTAPAPTDALFRLGLSRDNGASYTINASSTDPVHIYGEIVPVAAHRGRRVDVFVVDRINNKFTMKDEDENFISWNGQITSLVPALSNVPLEAVTRVDIFSGQLGIGGKHQLFLGYKLDGDLYYTPVPHQLEVSGAQQNDAFLILSNSDEFKPGKLLVFDYQGPPLDTSGLRVSVDGLPALADIDSGRLRVVVPPGSSGAADIVVTAGDTTLRHSITVQPASVILKPKQYVADVLDRILLDWQGAADNPFAATYNTIAQAKAQVATMNEQDASLLATLLQQLLDEDPGLSSQALLSSVDFSFDSQCDSASTSFRSTVISVLKEQKKLASVLSFGVVLSFTQPHLGLPLVAVAGWKLRKGLMAVSGKVGDVVDHCVGPVTASIERDFQTTSGTMQALTLNVPGSLELYSGIEQRIAVRLVPGMQDPAFQTWVLQMLADMRQQVLGIGAQLGLNVSPLLDYLKVQVNANDVSNPQDFVLSADITGVSGAITARGDGWLNVRFTFNPDVLVNESWFNLTLTSASRNLVLSTPVRLRRGVADLRLSNNTFVAPNIATSWVDEQKVFRLLQGVKAPTTAALTLQNTGGADWVLASASLEDAPTGLTLSVGSQRLAPGASTTLNLQMQMSAATYPQLEIMHGRAPGRRFFVNMKDTAGKAYRYAMEVWFVHYGSYDVTRTTASAQAACRLPSRSFVAPVSGDPFASFYNIRINNVGIPRVDYQADGTVTFRLNHSYQEQEGIVVEDLTVRIDALGKLSGSSTWRWSDDDSSCSGTATYSGQIR